MPEFEVTFTRTIEQSCSITIKAKNAETAEDKISSGNFREQDVNIDDTSEDISDIDVNEV